MENRKLVRLGEGSAAVDLSRTAFRIVQAGREDDEIRLEGRETGDGEEETMDWEREDCEESGVAKPIGENDHLEGEVGEDGERALSEEDEMDDMFRSSNLIIIPFPRERNRSSQISDPGVNDGAVEEEREEVEVEVEEVQSENDIEIEEELGKSESKDTAEENSDKSDQANDLSRQLVDVGRQLKTWRRSINHCQPSKLRALVHRLLEKVSELRPRLLELNLAVHAFAAEAVTRPGWESRKKVSQGLKDHLVRLYSQASRFRRMLESEARKVNYLFPEEPASSSTYDQHVKRLEHFRLSPAPRSPKPGRKPRFWMIWFLAGVAAAASMALTIYARPQCCGAGPFSVAPSLKTWASGPKPF